MPDHTEVLTAHRVAPAVVNVLDNAQKYAVLVTAYLRPWVHLTQAVANARKRGVEIRCILRDPDGAKRDREKTKAARAELEELGVVFHIVKRLHAKVYLNESEAVVTSFNLVGGSHDSVEFGVRLTEKAVVTDCFEAVRQYEDSLDQLVDGQAKPKATDAKFKAGFCVGCADAGHPYDPKKPLCRSCYTQSKRATDYDALSARVCHSCGSAHAATVARPLCYRCYKRLLPAEREALAE